ncbi:hypothetical protein Gotri_015457 [Gossypium trilobum]|uniref:Uncharacterized protein n=1 Tax=Gossypium trilobum TaxID=34281 RepID=A0A7J9E0D7_9ROSI|nr:hypothetical protein [Gossypium trilobum]
MVPLRRSKLVKKKKKSQKLQVHQAPPLKAIVTRQIQRFLRFKNLIIFMSEHVLVKPLTVTA